MHHEGTLKNFLFTRALVIYLCKVPSSITGSGCQLWDRSLAHIFGASTGVVPREHLIDVLTKSNYTYNCF